MSKYLDNLRSRYDELRKGIEGLQQKAVDESRDLDETELRSVTEQGEQAKTLFSQIEQMTAVEERHRKVAELAGKVIESGEDKGEHTRSTSTTTTKDRDPGHYRSVAEGGEHSFFGDIMRARENGDDNASRRLSEHNRALTTGGAGTGIVPPKWLTDEYAGIARQSRRVSAAVRNIPLGTDPRPIVLPKQTGAVTVTKQTNEGDILPWPDEYTSNVDTVTPRPTVGKAKVARQMMDSSSPAVDLLVYGDLVAAYNSQIEADVCTVMVAAAGTPVKTFATQSAFSAADGPDAIIDAAIAVRNARKLPADILVPTVTRYGSMLKWKDTTNRPLIPSDSGGPMNVIGVGDVAVDGRIEGLGVLATDGIPSTYPESILVARASDTILFEGSQLRFRYEEPDGPELIRLGIWAYTAVITRYAGASVKRIQITAS